MESVVFPYLAMEKNVSQIFQIVLVILQVPLNSFGFPHLKDGFFIPYLICLNMPLDFGQSKEMFDHVGKEVVRIVSLIDLQNISKICTLSDHITVDILVVKESCIYSPGSGDR